MLPELPDGQKERRVPLARRTHRAGGEQPPDDGPAREDVGAEHLVGGVDHAADVAYEVAAQGLAVGGGQILPLKPVLVPLLLAEPHLEGKGEPRVLLRARGKLRKKTTRTTTGLICPPASCLFWQAPLHALLPHQPHVGRELEEAKGPLCSAPPAERTGPHAPRTARGAARRGGSSPAWRASTDKG